MHIIRIVDRGAFTEKTGIWHRFRERDARVLAADLIRRGCVWVRVEYPSGAELDVRQEKKDGTQAPQ